MVRAIINGICGGVIGYCLKPELAVIGVIALFVLLVTLMAKMNIPSFALPYLLRLHRNALKKPYYHIGQYMSRYWILGDRSPERNDSNPRWQKPGFVVPQSGWLYRLLCRFIAVRAHWTFTSDADRHLHDHPWWSISIVLSGGYYEVCAPTKAAKQFALLYAYYMHSVDSGIARGESILNHDVAAMFGIHWRGPGSIVFRRAKTAHRLILPRGTIAKSIFVMGRATNSPWGFYVAGKKVPWSEYLRDVESVENVQ